MTEARRATRRATGRATGLLDQDLSRRGPDWWDLSCRTWASWMCSRFLVVPGARASIPKARPEGGGEEDEGGPEGWYEMP